MELKEYQAIVNKISQNLNNQALITELLTTLQDDYTQTQNNLTNLTEQTQKAQDEISQLQKTNMNLFLRVSSPTPSDTLQNKDPLKYEDLIKTMEGNQ
jgi:hypothetical protein